jgi:hypothetical protein
MSTESSDSFVLSLDNRAAMKIIFHFDSMAAALPGRGELDTMNTFM